MILFNIFNNNTYNLHDKIIVAPPPISEKNKTTTTTTKNTQNRTNRKHNEFMRIITQHKKIIQHKTWHIQQNNRTRQLPWKIINIIRNRTHSNNKIKKSITKHKKNIIISNTQNLKKKTLKDYLS